jgi:cyclohexanecarboxylate-CoA ligase
MVLGRTLWELLERRVDDTPDALMVVDEDMRTLTFAEFWTEAEIAAAGLHAAGLHRGDVVSWQLPNWIETVVLVAALARLGVVQNPLAPQLADAEVERLTTRAGSSLLVVPPHWGDRDSEGAATSIARRDGHMRVLLVDRALPQGDPTVLPELPGWAEAAEADEAPVSWLLHTAGTTGAPKLVQHTDATLAAAATGLCKRLELIEADRHALAAPLGGVTGLVWLFAALQSGCANILTASLDPAETCEVLAREGVTLAGSFPEHHADYVREQRGSLHPLFPDVRAFPVSGQAEPGELVEDVRSSFDVPVLASYGTTEFPFAVSASLNEHERGPAGEGTPVNGVEVRLVDQHGAVSDEGEVRLRGPQSMRGYDDGAMTTEAFDEDGFFRTGDLGRIDEHGVLRILGRNPELIQRGSTTVSVADLEQILHLHEKVADVAVIGVPDPDPDEGERVCAVVQVEGGHDDLTIDEVIIHLRDSGIGAEGLPEQLQIVEMLPRDPSGTLLRQLLRDELKG